MTTTGLFPPTCTSNRGRQATHIQCFRQWQRRVSGPTASFSRWRPVRSLRDRAARQPAGNGCWALRDHKTSCESRRHSLHPALHHPQSGDLAHVVDEQTRLHHLSRRNHQRTPAQRPAFTCRFDRREQARTQDQLSKCDRSRCESGQVQRLVGRVRLIRRSKRSPHGETHLRHQFPKLCQ